MVLSFIPKKKAISVQENFLDFKEKWFKTLGSPPEGSGRFRKMQRWEGMLCIYFHASKLVLENTWFLSVNQLKTVCYYDQTHKRTALIGNWQSETKNRNLHRNLNNYSNREQIFPLHSQYNGNEFTPGNSRFLSPRTVFHSACSRLFQVFTPSGKAHQNVQNNDERSSERRKRRTSPRVFFARYLFAPFSHSAHPSPLSERLGQGIPSGSPRSQDSTLVVEVAEQNSE